MPWYIHYNLIQFAALEPKSTCEFRRNSELELRRCSHAGGRHIECSKMLCRTTF